MAVILVADDETMVRSFVSMVLISAGHQVLKAANGLEAVALFRSFPASIDLVITDLLMPVMDGYELVRLIRHDRPEAKIICMTGYPDQEPPAGTMMLPKPFLPGQLRQLVDRLCSDRPA
jgi:CheY-like chemotaxis protein